MFLSCRRLLYVISPTRSLRGPVTQDTNKPEIQPVSEPESMLCPFLRVSWASFEQIVLGVPVELCSMRATSNWLGVVLSVWRYRTLRNNNKKTTGNFLCQTALLLLGHAQVCCTYFGRGRVNETQTSSEKRNRRHIKERLNCELKSSPRRQFIFFCSEVRSLYLDRSSSSSDVLSGLPGQGEHPSRACNSRSR